MQDWGLEDLVAASSSATSLIHLFVDPVPCTISKIRFESISATNAKVGDANGPLLPPSSLPRPNRLCPINSWASPQHYLIVPT